jgi:dolichol-phosphate mannosyltransferase
MSPEPRIPRLSVVAPCYNEQASLPEFHRRVSAACRSLVGDGHEIVLVNDGSRDGTWARIAELVAKDPRCVGVNLARNHGHQLALTAGLHVCKGERVLIIDADLQDPPELLGAMMQAMDQGADVVYGQRAKRAGETWFKRATATAFYRVLGSLTDVPIPVDTGDFRLMSRRALDILNAMPEQHRFIRGMVSWIGLEQVAVEYDRAPRFAGTTNYPFSKMLRFAVDAITGFSTRPLRLASYLGIWAGLGALVMTAYVAASWLEDRTVPGWTSLMAVVLMMGSAQLIVLGVLGEYFGRMYMEAKKRPLFIVERIIRQQEQPKRRDVTVSRDSPAWLEDVAIK